MHTILFTASIRSLAESISQARAALLGGGGGGGRRTKSVRGRGGGDRGGPVAGGVPGAPWL
eukprot:COSAG04_NODE_610_length_12023_cov_33.280023_1_plen_60_part_10